MSLNLKRRWLPGLLAVAVGTTLAWQSQAFDDEAATAPAAEKKADAADAIAVPDGTPEELLKFIDKLNSTRPTGTSRDELIENFTKMQNAVISAGKKILEAKPTDEQAAEAINAQLKAYNVLGRIGDTTAADKAAALVKSLKDDKRPAIQKVVGRLAVEQAIAGLRGADATKIAEVVAQVKDYLKDNKLNKEAIGMVYPLLTAAERSGDEKLAVKAYREFGEIFAKSDEPELKNYGEKFIGASRRLDLLGNPIEISGTTLDGKKFDISQYKGKVVLVDFWATWCGPCVAELPNVVDNYEAYHSKGFEVVGISLDESKDKVEAFIEDKKIPWVTLYSDDEKTAGWNNPMATHYGIMGIPTVILVDQQGKVVSLRARGPELGKQLEKLLGAPEKTTDEKTGDKSAAASEKDAL